MNELNYKQRLAHKYYKAYSTLDSNVDEAKNYSLKELEELKALRSLLFMMYKKYDPDNSFDVSRDYHYDIR